MSDLHNELAIQLRSGGKQFKTLYELCTFAVLFPSVTTAVISRYVISLRAAYEETMNELKAQDAKITKISRMGTVQLDSGSRILFVHWEDDCQRLRGLSLDAVVVLT